MRRSLDKIMMVGHRSQSIFFVDCHNSDMPKSKRSKLGETAVVRKGGYQTDTMTSVVDPGSEENKRAQKFADERGRIDVSR